MEKTSSATRATYLKLRRIAKVGTDLVRFSTPVVVRAGDFRVPLPIDDGSSGSVLGPNNGVIGRHGILHSLTPESITLQMSGSSRPIRIQRMRIGHLVEKNSIEVPKNHSLVIPFEVIRAVWRDSAKTQYLFFALDAEIVWDESSWLLTTGVYHQPGEN